MGDLIRSDPRFSKSRGHLLRLGRDLRLRLVEPESLGLGDLRLEIEDLSVFLFLLLRSLVRELLLSLLGVDLCDRDFVREIRGLGLLLDLLGAVFGRSGENTRSLGRECVDLFL